MHVAAGLTKNNNKKPTLSSLSAPSQQALSQPANAACLLQRVWCVPHLHLTFWLFHRSNQHGLQKLCNFPPDLPNCSTSKTAHKPASSQHCHHQNSVPPALLKTFRLRLGFCLSLDQDPENPINFDGLQQDLKIRYKMLGHNDIGYNPKLYVHNDGWEPQSPRYTPTVQAIISAF
jgi:hypothetical protein